VIDVPPNSRFPPTDLRLSGRDSIGVPCKLRFPPTDLRLSGRDFIGVPSKLRSPLLPSFIYSVFFSEFLVHTSPLVL